MCEKYTKMLPELTVSLRPNNQITIGLQNVYRKAEQSYQERYYAKHHYDKEVGGVIYEKMPIEPFWQQVLLRDRIAEQKLASARLAKCEKHTKVSYDFSPVPPLDIIRKFQRELKGSLCVALRFLALRKIIQALIVFSQYRLPKAKRFSNVAGQKLRECGAAIDMLCDGNPSEARVVTLTLPANYKEAFKVMAAYSGYAINRLFQPIRRHFKEISAWFFVWEHQKRGALHLHICIHCGDARQSELAGQKLLEQWHDVLCDISEQSGVCMFSNSTRRACTIRANHQNVNQVMEKSCGQYFSKYAGKSADTEENSYVHRFARLYPPTRFWGSSKKVKEVIKENSFSFSLDSVPSDSKEKFNELMELIMEKEVVQFNEYEWKLETRKKFERISKPDFKPDSKPVKYIGVEKRVISEGFRNVFYVSPKDYQELLASIPLAVSMFEVF